MLLEKKFLSVNKIIYHDASSAYTVFEGISLQKNRKTGTFRITREKNIYVGYFFCIFAGDTVEADVEATYSKVYGAQYAILAGKRIEPVTESEIKSFLSKNIKGMTPKRLEKLMDAYGLSVLDAIKNDPNALDFLGLDPLVTKSLYTELSCNAHFEDIIVFLSSVEIDCRLAHPLFSKYGANTESFLRADPYQAYLDGIFDFKTADRLYLRLGYPPDSSLRCTYGILETLRHDAQWQGNVYVRRNRLLKKLNDILSTTNGKPFTEKQLTQSLLRLEEMGRIILENSDNEEAVYLKENYYDEHEILKCLTRFITEPKGYTSTPASIEDFFQNYEKTAMISLADEQKQAVITALTSPISIISGGPGTGKTQTINAIIAAIRLFNPKAVIRACAPTGKAAQRLSELTYMNASTIHRMIGYGSFDRFEQHGSLYCDYVFVDEFSMVDIHLCAKLFDAVSPNARVIIVGDINQLPSVGPGLVLRDFINSGKIPTTFLTKIFRQALNSNIVLNAHRIINQEPDKPIYLRIRNTPGGDFYFLKETDPEAIERKILATIDKLSKKYKLGTNAIQVLSPIHNTILGTDHLNSVLQHHLNKSEVEITYEDKEFRLGDKVIHTVNDYDLEVFNGEVGTITDISFSKNHALTVTYPDRDVCYAFKDLNELELAYSLTIHKMQGSEQPVIILPIHETLAYGLNKNSIYTALTRAKSKVILIGCPESLSKGIRRETTIERESKLCSRIQKRLV